MTDDKSCSAYDELTAKARELQYRLNKVMKAYDTAMLIKQDTDEILEDLAKISSEYNEAKTKLRNTEQPIRRYKK